MGKFIKKCEYEYCNAEFETDNPRKRYCKPSHRIRASEFRNGKEAPDYILGDDYEVINKEKEVSKPNPIYISIQKEITELKTKRFFLMNRRNEYGFKINDLGFDQNRNLGAIGIGAATLTLTSTVKNNWIRTALVAGGVIAGAGLFKRSDEATVLNNDLINQYQEEIKKIDLEIKPIDLELLLKQYSLSHTPKELAEKQVLEIKVPKQKGVEEPKNQRTKEPDE